MRAANAGTSMRDRTRVHSLMLLSPRLPLRHQVEVVAIFNVLCLYFIHLNALAR